jgi:hypothetical protein
METIRRKWLFLVLSDLDHLGHDPRILACDPHARWAASSRIRCWSCKSFGLQWP